MPPLTRSPAAPGHRRAGIARQFVLLLAGVLAVACFAVGDAAARGERTGIIDLATRHHAPSDTYYQLLRDWKTTQGVTWIEAHQRAAARVYKGRAGRLAIIRDREVFAWVLKSLPLASVGLGQGETWIGLRYWCRARELVWVDLQPHARDAASPWAVPWNRGGNDACARTSNRYMGVYHLGELGRWQAVAAPKRFPHYIVEYPPNRAPAAGSDPGTAPAGGNAELVGR